LVAVGSIDGNHFGIDRLAEFGQFEHWNKLYRSFEEQFL